MRRAAFLAKRATQNDRDNASLSSDSDDSLGGIHEPHQMPGPTPDTEGHSDDADSDTEAHPVPTDDPTRPDGPPSSGESESELTDSNDETGPVEPPSCSFRRSPRLQAQGASYAGDPAHASELPGD